jgi:hypothetical protein
MLEYGRHETIALQCKACRNFPHWATRRTRRGCAVSAAVFTRAVAGGRFSGHEGAVDWKNMVLRNTSAAFP